MGRPATQHCDARGALIELGQTVATPCTATCLGVGEVIDIHPVMVKVRHTYKFRSHHVGTLNERTTTDLRYPENIVVLSDPKAKEEENGS